MITNEEQLKLTRWYRISKNNESRGVWEFVGWNRTKLLFMDADKDELKLPRLAEGQTVWMFEEVEAKI